MGFFVVVVVCFVFNYLYQCIIRITFKITVSGLPPLFVVYLMR